MLKNKQVKIRKLMNSNQKVIRWKKLQKEDVKIKKNKLKYNSLYKMKLIYLIFHKEIANK